LPIDSPKWKDIEWSIRTLVAAEAEESGNEDIAKDFKELNVSNKDTSDKFERKDKEKNTQYRSRRSSNEYDGVEMALFTLPPNKGDASEYEEILVQLFYQYRIIEGELAGDMSGIKSGMVGFIKELLNTNYP